MNGLHGHEVRFWNSRLPLGMELAVFTLYFFGLPLGVVQGQQPWIPAPPEDRIDAPAHLKSDLEPLPAVSRTPPPEATPQQGEGVLGVADLESIALANNPTLHQAMQRIAALKGKCVQVGLRPNPVIGYKGEDMGEEGAAGKHGMFVGKRIVTAGKLGLNRAVVSHEIQQARQDLEIQQLRVLTAVRSGAYETVIAQRRLALSESLLTIAQKGTRAAEELFQAREVSQVDVLQARVEAGSAKITLRNAQKDYEAAWQRLVVVMGVPGMMPQRLADHLGEALPELTWDAAANRLLTVSPELAKARSGVERARCALARAQAGRKPDFDVGTAVQYNYATENTMATVELGVPLQIFDRNQGNISKAYAEFAAAKWEVDRVRLLLQERLVERYKRYAKAHAQVEEYTKEILPNAKSSLDLTRKGYEQGEFGYLELLTAQRTYFRVNLAYLESLRGLWVSAIEIEGLLLTGGLQSPSTLSSVNFGVQ